MPVTRTGIDKKKLLGHLLNLYHKKTITNGLLFCNQNGSKVKALDFKRSFFERLEQAQSSRPDLITSTDDVVDDYGIYCSFHHSSMSEATNQGPPPEVIDANNHWRKFHRQEPQSLLYL